MSWKSGATLDELFERCVFLNKLLEKEEVQKERITEKNREYFDRLIKLMITRRILLPLPDNGKIVLRLGSETFHIFVSSLIWPMIDSYYVTLLYGLSMAIGKDQGSAAIEASQIIKRIQWLSESLFEEKVIKYYEACNVESVKNAVALFKETGVMQQKSTYIMLSERYRSDERLLTNLLEQINQYRSHASVPEVLAKIAPHSSQTLRRSLMVDFPFMAKL